MRILYTLLAMAQDAGDATAPVVQPPSITEQWDGLVKYLQEQGVSLGLNVLAAIAIFIIGRIVVGFVVGFVSKRLEGRLDVTLVKFLSSLARVLLMAVVIMAALERLGVETTSLAAIMAAAGLAIGLALQGSLSNFASGVMIVLFKPFKVGDFVEAAGAAGTIEDIQIFNTILKTGDNRVIIVPNSAITGGSITNFSTMPTRRIDLVFGCGYGDDLRAVKAYLEEAVTGDERILPEPAPVVAVNELGDSSVNFVVRPWVKAADYWAVRWDLTEKIKLGFDERGYSIPYPSQDVYMHQESNG